MPTDFSPDFTGVASADRSIDQRFQFIRQALAPAEQLMIALTLCVGLLAFTLAQISGQAVAWDKFLISFVPSVGLILLGCFVRNKRNMPRAAMTAISAGIYIGFSGVIAILIYLRFPFDVPMIDDRLMAIDAALFGYSWQGFTTAMATYPTLGKVIGAIYGTSLAQLFLVIFILGFLGRLVDLHRLLITGTLSLLMAVGFWWTWPSLGPSAYTSLPVEVETALGLVHGHAEGSFLMQMATSGVPLISPEIIMGTIAFPSYHTVMLCLAVGFVWRTWAFWPMVLLNIGMLPSILSHGGHHLSDMLGGIVVFFIAFLIAVKLVPRDG
ncbi:phosphatase PAP2 family protein [Sulfitobacter sp. F26204]|uniref:phosphatase PAP2 family protein n=1 Tax=Sulfitobacter sp. F26204 TaxID=2996014 RepID=UPI00225DEEE4|nr:phosphatase PAP2 family protein [Sulfitobacter sp. F26204]MCX7558584.1 phosphatase PAP2 family protein [Sulfitobacter sp. F26204]